MTIRVAHAVVPGRVLRNAEIRIDDGRITSVTPYTGDAAMHDLWAVPGFVDTHCHGGAGVSFGDPSPDANLRAIDFHRRQGSTTIIASTVTDSEPRLIEQIAILRALTEQGDLAGIHLEGPFLSEAKRGAHNPELLRTPDEGFVERLLEAAGDALRMVTLAAELDLDGVVTRRFVEAGVKVAFGHSDANHAEVVAALDFGVTIATHLFSAMRPIHHREPGPIPALMLDDRVTVELICDGVHLHPAAVALAIATAGPERVALITDAIHATGCGDGHYAIAGQAIDVVDGTARLGASTTAPGALAGSTLTMARAFEFLVGRLGVSIPDTAMMAATTPAAAHGLADVGTIAPGKWADICLVDAAGQLRHVWRRGEQIR